MLNIPEIVDFSGYLKRNFRVVNEEAGQNRGDEAKIINLAEYRLKRKPFEAVKLTPEEVKRLLMPGADTGDFDFVA